jgi:hypothetical protein
MPLLPSRPGPHCHQAETLAVPTIAVLSGAVSGRHGFLGADVEPCLHSTQTPALVGCVKQVF